VARERVTAANTNEKAAENADCAPRFAIADNTQTAARFISNIVIPIFFSGKIMKHPNPADTISAAPRIWIIEPTAGSS